MTTYLKDGRWQMMIKPPEQPPSRPRLSKEEQQRQAALKRKLDDIEAEREAMEMTREVWDY